MGKLTQLKAINTIRFTRLNTPFYDRLKPNKRNPESVLIKIEK